MPQSEMAQEAARENLSENCGERTARVGFTRHRKSQPFQEPQRKSR